MSRTPLRYPGGKQKLAPFVEEILAANLLEGCEYAEPYAGGAGVAIDLLFRGVVSKVHLNDASFPVFCFWKSILDEPETFCRRIASASMTIDEWRKQREILRRAKEFSKFEVGFALFFLNRCNRSGIASAGVIGGLDQTGRWKMDARFPANELISRIESIAARRRSIRVKNWDAERFIQEYLPQLPKRTLVYCDPPYFHKADRLYPNHYAPGDHARIAQLIQRKIHQPWIVSYDSVPEILECYSDRKHFIYDLQYHAGKAYKGREVFIFADRVKIPTESSLPYIAQALTSLR